MDASIELQKQVKENAEDLQHYLSDLVTWAGEMKSQSSENEKSSTSKPIPPIRNLTKKRESNDNDGNTAGSKVSKRISSLDYDKWNKFDVEKACKQVDNKEMEDKSHVRDLKAQDEAQYEKERGNRFVKNQKWDDAIVCYSKAIKCYPKDATFYANRALCYLKKKQYRSVEADCTTALQLEADYVKALQRRAAARRELNQLDDASKDLEKALSLEPSNTALKADLALVKQKLTSSVPSKQKQTQEKEPLKWVPPAKVEAGPSSCATKTTQKSAPIKIPSAPVVIEPAQKHKKSGQVSIGEDTESMSKQKSHTPKIELITKMPAEPPEKSDHSTSIKWFTKEGTTVVEPIIKPPHRRSQQPLKRIPIKECPNYNLLADIESTSKNIQEKKKSSKAPDMDGPGESVTKTGEDLKSKVDVPKEKCQTEIYKTAAELPVPSTSVQFIATWKLIQNIPQLRFQFLKKIPASHIPKIFQDCLESDILSGMINTFECDFTKENVPVYEYLLELSRVKRFHMLSMFLSAADKRGLKTLFEYCLTKEACTEESVNNLKKVYEL